MSAFVRIEPRARLLLPTKGLARPATYARSTVSFSKDDLLKLRQAQVMLTEAMGRPISRSEAIRLAVAVLLRCDCTVQLSMARDEVPTPDEDKEDSASGPR